MYTANMPRHFKVMGLSVKTYSARGLAWSELWTALLCCSFTLNLQAEIQECVPVHIRVVGNPQ